MILDLRPFGKFISSFSSFFWILPEIEIFEGSEKIVHLVLFIFFKGLACKV